MPGITQFSTVNARKTRLAIKPLLRESSVSIIKGSSLKADQIARQNISPLFTTSGKAPALRLDELNPLVKSLLQVAVLAIETEADGKAKFLKLSDSQFFA